MPYLRSFLVAAALPTLAFLLLGIYLQPLSGDLTRLGNLSERSWGWNREQPVIDVRRNDADQEAPVLVIGDSFSELNLWQSVASAQLRAGFLSFHWADIGNAACLGSTISVLRRQYPKSRYLVIEAVERTLLRRFPAADPQAPACPDKLSTSIHAEPAPTQAKRDRYADPMPDPIYAVRALVSEQRPFEQTTPLGQAFVSPLRRADLFSNRRADHLLFISEDVAKNDWQPEDIGRAIDRMNQVADLQRELDLQIIFVVVPDKTTVYAPFLRDAVFPNGTFDVWGELHRRNLASVDLRTIFELAAANQVDFYLPDDTHLGTQGYRVMGAAVAGVLRRVGAQSGSRSGLLSGLPQEAP